jgi:hypothetical protein
MQGLILSDCYLTEIETSGFENALVETIWNSAYEFPGIIYEFPTFFSANPFFLFHQQPAETLNI